MNAFTASEEEFKNGYEKGYREGYSVGFDEGAQQNAPPTGFWKWTPEGNRVCSKCGMLEPDSLPGACAINPSEKRYCFFCGARLIYPKGQ